MEKGIRSVVIAGGALLALWFFSRYVLVLIKPFLVGALLALAAEPLVRFLSKQCRVPRGCSAGIGVSLTLLILLGLTGALVTWGVQELGKLTERLPGIGQAVQSSLEQLRQWLTALSQKAPAGMRGTLAKMVEDTFNGGEAMVDTVVRQLPQTVTAVLGGLPDGVLAVGTGLLSAYMISARLPRLKGAIERRLPEKWKQQYVPALHRAKLTVWAWLKAQGKLMAVTYAIVAVGFWMLKIPYAPVWAAGVALVDAMPVLGTGTILIPWSVLLLLQGQLPRALGMAAVYLIAMLTRSVLEPRFVGRQLGLDPLVTLLAFYAGYRLWGIAGMILMPMLAAAGKTLLADL